MGTTKGFFGIPFATGLRRDVKRRDMKTRIRSNDPGRKLAHASLYLWRHWRQYALAAWEDAEGILRHAYDAVEAEDRIEFIRALDITAGATMQE
jgi:hypothetical protein